MADYFKIQIKEANIKKNRNFKLIERCYILLLVLLICSFFLYDYTNCTSEDNIIANQYFIEQYIIIISISGSIGTFILILSIISLRRSEIIGTVGIGLLGCGLMVIILVVELGLSFRLQCDPQFALYLGFSSWIGMIILKFSF